MKKLLTLLLFLSYFLSNAQDITGTWNGLLVSPGGKLNLVFNITKSGNTYTATMDSPDQGAKGIPVETVTFENSKTLKLEIPMAKISYSGEWTASNTIVGTFSQNGQDYPMDLSRKKITLKRPQEPKPPFSYYSEDVTFNNTKENFSLAGTLTLPKKDGKFPVVVLISGSGAQDRNSEILGHKPFLVIADYLTKKGIGVLRVDDRGVGESKGDRTKATSQDYAVDVASAVAYLKTRKDIDSKKIGLIGHSEGGVIAPMVAAKSNDIRAIVLLAGTGIPGDELLLKQKYLLEKASGASEEELQKGQDINKKIYEIIRTVKDPQEAKKQMAALMVSLFDDAPADQKPPVEQLNEIANQQAAAMLSPWMTFFISYDPALALKEVKCPVLVLNGEKDLQVPAKVNTEAIKNALEKNGNKKVTVKILPNLNHLFQESQTGAFDEYEKIEQTFSPVALKEISDWLSAQFK